MAVLGVMMMMVKNQVAEQGMFAVLQRIKDLDIDAVEVSQIPMSEENTADLERAVKELGMIVGALSVALKPGPTATGDNLEENFDKIVSDCKRLGTKFVRIGMMPHRAMASKEACEAWAAECEQAAQRLAAEGITLCYHNHHVDLAQFDGERIFDIVRRVAPSLYFEVDLHWVQRGGMAPLDMLELYSGVCKIIHVKDFRVQPLPAEALDAIESGDRATFQSLFNNIVQFAEVGQGNMNWPQLLPAAEKAGAEFFFIEQDDTYGRDPFDCIADSRAYLASIGY
ncbi:sugar phosphate isomerase/epimerase [Propioniciclava coleopterorum]|uniref:Sugar phosphate isomerase/epimerase n=1 Tax=Propioniciclava coleopterorum TaxID=2714937 RepID=A0A6G7Y5D1_9ACTN|nr:sugar phosphate isomerase/epimerase [Propioniciclava coleopterorum]QIK72032.1 sugar phosphate isomerase/epimerase [Propioniciclava coleopterorum]